MASWRPESAVAGSYKIATCGAGSVPHLTVVAKEVTGSQHQERCYGPRVHLAGDSKWLISHLSESASLSERASGSLDRDPDYYTAMNQRQTDSVFFVRAPSFPRKRAPEWVPKRF